LSEEHGVSDREPDDPIPEPPPYDPDFSLIGDMQRSEATSDDTSWMTKLIHWRRSS
jgi:hypothetical protein